MIEVFNIIANNNSINNIQTTDLIDLFVKGDNSIYEISLVGKGNVILKNKNENKFEKLDCVCKYLEVQQQDCNDIFAAFNMPSHTTCKECYKHFLEKLNSGEIGLK